MSSKKSKGGFRDFELANPFGSLDHEPNRAEKRSFGSGKRRRIAGVYQDMEKRGNSRPSTASR